MPKKIRLAPKYAPLTVGDADLTVRINLPASAVVDLQSGDAKRVVAALTAIVKEHPWVDENDQPLAVADLPFETYGEIAAAYGTLLNALPKA